MKNFNNCVAVITGAGSGIGQQLTYKLADAGAKIAISDINIESLAKTRIEATQRGATVKATVLDVADQDAFYRYATDVESEFGKVNLVINNAGVALASGPLWTTPIDDFKWLMNINFYGVLYGTKAFLPILEKAEWGHIVNISSIFGIVSIPEQTAYNAAKFAVKGMTDALRQELELADSSVSCTSVHPGGIKTNIARAARLSDNGDADLVDRHKQGVSDFEEKLARTSPAKAAELILKAVEQNKRRLLIGGDAKFVDILQRLFPTYYHKILQLIIGRD